MDSFGPLRRAVMALVGVLKTTSTNALSLAITEMQAFKKALA
jgi:hypothetical protein